MPKEELELAEGEPEEVRAVHSIRSENFRVVYANFAQCGFTAWDIRINFGLVGVDGSGQPTLTEEAAVVVTPAMAKALVNVLTGHIKAFERDNGEIAMPQSLVRQAQAQRAEAEAKKAKESEPAAEPA